MYNKKKVVLNSSSGYWYCCHASAGSRLGGDSTDWIKVAVGTDASVLTVGDDEDNSPSFPTYNTEVLVRRMLMERVYTETFVSVAVMDVWKG
jgi:hypothetical protein